MTVPGRALFVVLAVVIAPGVASGQAPAGDPPRTPWGDPDLQGIWNNISGAPLERPANLGERDTLTDEEVQERAQRNRTFFFAERPGDPGFYNEFWFEGGRDANNASLVIDPPDGRLPPLTPEASEAQTANMRRQFQAMQAPATYLDVNLWERCITRSMPGAMLPGQYNANYQILQTPEYVVLLVEMIHDTRIIPLTGAPPPSPNVHQWLGSSRGHWDGDTLVVESTNFSAKGNERGITGTFGTGEHLRLTERFTRVSEDTLDYRFTVDDASMFTASWTAAVPMLKIEGPLFEYACHEGNYALPNMLRGARAAEQGAP